MTDNYRLVMDQGPQSGQTFSLDKDALGLGRDPGNDIVINDPQVSRQHARITRQGGLVVIEDLGSTNGTFANGVRLVEPHTLVNGDVIGLGNAVTLTYYGMGIAATEVLTGQPTVSSPPPSYAPQPPAFEPAPPPSYAPQPPAFEPAPPPSYAPQPPAFEPAPPPSYAPPPLAFEPAPPPAYTPAVEEQQSKTRLWVGCGCVVLFALVCIAVGVFVWYAPESFWQALIDLGIPVPTWPF